MENGKVLCTSLQLTKHKFFSHLGIFLLFIPILALWASCNKSSSSSTSTTTTAEGQYTQSSETVTFTSQTINLTTADLCAITLSNTGMLTLNKSKISTSGSSSSTDYSRYYGLNSAITAIGGSTLILSGNKVTTSGTGAAGVFSYNYSITSLSEDTISTTGQYSSAIVASGQGHLTANKTVLTTSGDYSPAASIDYGAGHLTINGGKVSTSGANSPAISSKGVMLVTDASISASGAEAAMLEGSNSITLSNATLSSSKADKSSVLIYQSESGEAAGHQGAFQMTGGTLSNTSTSSPLIFVTNTTALINLKSVSLSAASNVLVKAGAGSWGTSNLNGGQAIVTADGQTMKGDFLADKFSVLSLILKNSSSINGGINTAKTAIAANLSLDKSSTVSLTGDSYISVFDNLDAIADGAVKNVYGNGFNLYYQASVNSILAGKTYALQNGGQLIPY